VSVTGSLSTMPLADVLGWIAATNRVGGLTVHGVGSETTLKLKRGRVLECATSEPPVLLGQFLLFHGIIDEEVLDRAMRAHAEQNRRLGEVLLSMGAVSAEDLQEALLAKAEEAVLCAFDHATGWFTFDPDASGLNTAIDLDMPIADAIARGETRVRNAAVAAKLLKPSGSVLRKTDKTPSPKLSSVVSLRNAYALVDGERSIDEIVLHLHGTEFRVIQRLHQLVVEGFLEVVDRPETTPAGAADLVSKGMPAPVAAASVDLLDGIFPIALPLEYTQQSRNLSIVEKYLLTLCDGTRDLQRITAVAPVQSQVVVDTIRSLKDRGWLKAGPVVADH
jgi:Domain of unknown function (DUF4388)